MLGGVFWSWLFVLLLYFMGEQKSKLLNTPIFLTKSTVFKNLLLEIDQLNQTTHSTSFLSQVMITFKPKPGLKWKPYETTTLSQFPLETATFPRLANTGWVWRTYEVVLSNHKNLEVHRVNAISLSVQDAFLASCPNSPKLEMQHTDTLFDLD